MKSAEPIFAFLLQATFLYTYLQGKERAEDEEREDERGAEGVKIRSKDESEDKKSSKQQSENG